MKGDLRQDPSLGVLRVEPEGASQVSGFSKYRVRIQANRENRETGANTRFLHIDI